MRNTNTFINLFKDRVLKHNISIVIRTLVLVILILFITSCSSLLYHPDDRMYYPPEKMNIKYKDLPIEVEKKVKVHAWHLSSQKQSPKGLVIFFHGNAQNITSHYATLAWILKEGYDFVIWDYRGYGVSEGRPTPENTVLDGVKVIEYVLRTNPNQKIFIFGQSLGGAVAMRSYIEWKSRQGDSQNMERVKSVIVDSTFASYVSVSKNVLSKSYLTWLFQPLAHILISDKWAPKDKISQISPVPFVVMHGKRDGIVDFKFGKEIFDLAEEPKKFWSIEHGEHIDSFWGHNFEFRKKFLDHLNQF